VRIPDFNNAQSFSWRSTLGEPHVRAVIRDKCAEQGLAADCVGVVVRVDRNASLFKNGTDCAFFTDQNSEPEKEYRPYQDVLTVTLVDECDGVGWNGQPSGPNGEAIASSSMTTASGSG